MADHSIKLVNRQNMEIAGVNNVNTFDEEEIVLETNMGYLFIQGEELHITMLNLDEGKVALEGTVESMIYKNQGTDIKARGKNILNRLLK